MEGEPKFAYSGKRCGQFGKSISSNYLSSSYSSGNYFIFKLIESSPFQIHK